MTSIFAAAARSSLERLASPNALLAFDFDGTLAPIVEEPSEAFMRPRTAELLASLARLRRCAVISGRKRADVVPRLAGIPLVAVVGNHGAEWEDGDDPRAQLARERIAGLRTRIERRLMPLEGVRIEDKGLSLAIHLRGPASVDGVSAIVWSALDPSDGAHVFGGKRVLNVVLRDAPNKGTALRRLARQTSAEAALYIGDDVTDEDAFVNPGVDAFFPIRVGESPASKAAFFVRDQNEIDELLAMLLLLESR